MGCPSGPSDEPRLRSWTDEDASFASAALPLLLAAMGMTLLAVGLILTLPVLAMAGAGLSVVAFAIYLIVAGMDRADARAQASRRVVQTSRESLTAAPRRGPLADAAVAALTTPGARGGIWPPLSSTKDPSDAPARPTTAASRGAVPMWDAHGKVAPAAFQDAPAARHEPELVEFTSVQSGDGLLATMPGPGRTGNPAGIHVARTQEEMEASEPEHDHRMWPGTKDLGAWAHLTGERRSRADERSLEERRKAMVERRARLAERLPTVGAILAEGDSARGPPRSGATRGKCSRCSKHIWAPSERPITLKCPGCGHKARLY